MNERVERLRERVAEPFLVTNAVNVRYLLGFRSSNAAALVEPDRIRLFADFRYAAAGRALMGADFTQIGRNLHEGIAELVSGRIAFEADTVTYQQYETLRDGGIDLVPTYEVGKGLRAVKDEEELAAIRRASAIASRAFGRLADERFVGRTERELAWRMEQLLHEEGADGLAFPVIVASGPNAANPHTTPGERNVEDGDTVIVDAGAVAAGYCSDCTRTFAAVALPADLRDAYRVCHEAQLAGLEAVRAGVHGRAADAAARTVVDDSPFAGTFGHGLGHGVGLEVHESPGLRPESQDTLAAGNVASVEPGIYLEGRGGIRIEDLVVVTEGAPEILTTFPKELVTVS